MDRGPARSTPLGRRAKPRVVLEREVAYHLEGETRENMTAAQFEDLTENEAEEILRWRFSELLRVGYDTDAAMVVASHVEVDLHQATGLVLRGCPPNTALRIVL